MPGSLLFDYFLKNRYIKVSIIIMIILIIILIKSTIMHSLCYFHVINFHDFQVATFTAKNVLANPRERVSKSYFVKRNCSQYSIDL